MNNQHIIGWDIGGAHIKAAYLNVHTSTISVHQKACPLWKGIDQLHLALRAFAAELPLDNCLHAITMTGELVDCFENRQQGVMAIIRALEQHLPPDKCLIFSGFRGFLSLADIGNIDVEFIASANWLASAQIAAKHIQNGVFIDIGSTTTDILTLCDYEVTCDGYTDFQRLITGELVYTGVVRTPIMALCRTAPFMHFEVGIMAEHFATTSDIYRVTQDLNPEHDQYDTADGAPKTLRNSAIRLSRLIGYDYKDNDSELWLEFAHNLKQLHKEQLKTAITKRLPGPNYPLIGAGIGRFLVEELAKEMNFNYVDFKQCFASIQETNDAFDISDCAPAVAVASLAIDMG